MPMRTMIPTPPSDERGFTLIELVVVIVLLGALAAILLPRLGGESLRDAAFAEQVATAFRYAQRLAVATGCEVQVQVDAASGSYALTRRADGTDTSCGSSGAFTLPIANPTGGDFAGTATGGVQVTQGLTLRFDAQGLPTPNGGTAIIGDRAITIEADTGHVR